MILLRFASDLLHMLAEGLDLAIAQLAPADRGVEITRFWEDSNA